MKAIIVGGRFGDAPKESGVAIKLANALNADLVNGGSIQNLSEISLSGFELIIWMPKVDNGEAKIYPKKDIGAVLICSKFMGARVTRFDSVSRIFKMGGNAVIEIHPKAVHLPWLGRGDYVTFELVDALANWWRGTADIDALACSIRDLYDWTRGSVRVRTERSVEMPIADPPHDLERLVVSTKRVADMVETEYEGRFFGNASTRCAKMFPSHRVDDCAYVSARNIDKRRIEEDDFVCVRGVVDGIVYHGDRKPSVDTPIQLALYKRYPRIRCMIHGHVFIQDVPTTEHYFPCGDMREFEDVCKVISGTGPSGILNLKDHGFLMYGDSVGRLMDMIETMKIANKTKEW